MDLEAQLAEQLAEQQEALQGVQQLLEADPGSEETAALLEELQAGEHCGDWRSQDLSAARQSHVALTHLSIACPPQASATPRRRCWA